MDPLLPMVAFKAATEAIKKALSQARDSGFADVRELLLDAHEKVLDLRDDQIDWGENERLEAHLNQRANSLRERQAFWRRTSLEGKGE